MTSKTTAKDFFLYLGVFIGLYVSAINFLTLASAMIDKVFPVAGQYYYGDGTIRFALAALIIFFPAFIYLSVTVNKDLKVNPDSREMWVRKWLIFLTLFVSGLTVLIDLATLVYRFLGAEDLSIQFFLKVLIVALIAISIFRYYLYDLKRMSGDFAKSTKTFAYIISAIVLIAFIYGFILIQPFAQHGKNLDQTRVNDLMTIQNYVVYTQYQQKTTVPEKLVNDPISGFTIPLDPETKIPYEYKKISADSFELCATFSASSTDDQYPNRMYPVSMPYGGISDNWAHPIGHYCFSRVIDTNIIRINGTPVKY